MLRWTILVGFTILGSFAALSAGRGIGFVQFEAPSLHIGGTTTAVREAAQYVGDATTFGWSVLESNRIDLERHLDFAIIGLDFGRFDQEPRSAAAELASMIRGLTVTRVYVVAGASLGSDKVRSRYNEFVTEFKTALPRHQVIDLSGKSDRLEEYTLVGLDVSALNSEDTRVRDNELSRVERDVASGHVVLLFACLSRPGADGKLEATTLWKNPRWSAVAQNPNLRGIFVNIIGAGTPSASANNTPLDSLLRGVPPLYLSSDGLGRGLLSVRVALDGQVATVPRFMGTVGAQIEGEGTLFEGALKEQNGDYEVAYGLYREALKSKDAVVRMQAEAGLRRTNSAKQGWWERWKSELLAVRWLSNHWVEAAVVALLLLAFLSIRLLQHRVRVEMASKLTPDSPAELFMLNFIDSANVIPTIWNGMPASIAASSGLDVALSNETGKAIAKELSELKIPGIDVQSFLKWVLFLWRYPSWRMELSVFGTPAQTVVYARLRFAWYTKQVWMQPTSSTGPLDVRASAWALVCDLMMSRVVL
jgi:hypothetical protein